MQRKRTLTSLALLLLLTTMLYLFLPGCAQSMFYYPDNKDWGDSPANEQLAFENVYFPSADGTLLHAWFVPATDTSAGAAKGTVVHVHGNAGNMTTHWSFVNWLPALGYNVLTFDYRGYGESQGRPTPKGLFEDTQSAIRYARTRADVNPDRLLIIGQSLGGTNAIAAVGAMPIQEHLGICAMLIDSTFFSYSSIANEKLPGAGLLMNNDYSAERYIASLSPIPVWFTHGTADSIIPHQHSQRLYELAGPPKDISIIQGRGHIATLTIPAYRQQADAFFQHALQTCQPAMAARNESP